MGGGGGELPLPSGVVVLVRQTSCCWKWETALPFLRCVASEKNAHILTAAME